MIIKAIILSTMLNSDPAITIAMPQTQVERIEARKRHGKGDRGRRKGGGGLR